MVPSLKTMGGTQLLAQPVSVAGLPSGFFWWSGMNGEK